MAKFNNLDQQQQQRIVYYTQAIKRLHIQRNVCRPVLKLQSQKRFGLFLS